MTGITPEPDPKWARLVSSDPRRVVAVFETDITASWAKTPMGDSYLVSRFLSSSKHLHLSHDHMTIQDVQPAWTAVSAAFQSGPRTEYEALVRAGMIDKVCENISGKRIMMMRCPGPPSAGEEVCASRDRCG